MASEYLNNKTFEGIIKRFQYSKRQKSRYELIIQDLELAKQHRERRKDKKHHELAIILFEKKSHEYKQIHIEFTQSQDELAAAFYTLSQNIVKYAKFQHIDDDDAIQEGVVICFEKISHFDPQKGKAFNYMTTCILNHFRQLYRSARNYQELKKKYLCYLQKEFEKVIIHNGKQHSTTFKIPMEGTRSNY